MYYLRKRIPYKLRVQVFKFLTIFSFLRELKNSNIELMHLIRKPSWRGDNFASNNYMEFLSDEKFLDVFESSLKNTPSSLRLNFESIKYRVHVANWCAQQTKDIPGDFIELGVWYGILSSNIVRHLEFEKLDKKFYLIDPWGGIIGSRYNEDIYEVVRERFSSYSNVELVRGMAPKVLSNLKLKKIAFLIIDMNSVLPEIQSLEKLYPLMSCGGIIFFDDYANNGCEELRGAIDKFFFDKKESLLIFPSGNAIVIKL